MLKKIDRKVKFLTTIEKDSSITNKIITMDIETRVIGQFMKPICVSLFDGKIKKSFYLADFNSEEAMIEASIRYLMVRKYSGYKVYLHNFSNLDGIFLLQYLAN